MKATRSNFLSVFAVLATSVSSAVPCSVPLNGLWDFHLEADKSLEETAMPAFRADDRMLVPGCWDVATKY